MKNNTTLSIAIASFLLIGLNACAQKTDFSGSWKVNKEKSDFGELSPNSAPFAIQVKQDQDQFSIERHQKYADSELNCTENLNFDGKTVETTVKTGVKRTSSVKWSADGKTLTEQSTYSNGQKATETWTLSDDGNTLIIKKEVIMDGDEHQVNYVYDKQ